MKLSAIITSRFASWLEADGIRTRLHPHGFAVVALPTSVGTVDQLNQDVRACLPELASDDFIIGEDGAGNYFTVKITNPSGEVRFFDHEWKQYVDGEVWSSLRAYYEYCVGIERKSS